MSIAFRKSFTHDNNGPIDGFLLDHPQIQQIVNIMDDGVTAKLRGRSTMQAGRHVDYCDPSNPMTANPRQWWEGGLYENTYKKGEDGKWRIHILNYFPHWHADFDKGWAYTQEQYVPFPKVTYPEDPIGPDELMDAHWLWPTHKLLPFHMKHPITGEEMVAAALGRRRKARSREGGVRYSFSLDGRRMRRLGEPGYSG